MLENGIDKHQLFQPDHTTRRRPLHRYPDVAHTQCKLPACVLICLKSFVLIISANFSSTQLILCLSDGASSCRRGNNVWSRLLVTTPGHDSVPRVHQAELTSLLYLLPKHDCLYNMHWPMQLFMGNSWWLLSTLCPPCLVYFILIVAHRLLILFHRLTSPSL